jgi:hypothetical protein
MQTLAHVNEYKCRRDVTIRIVLRLGDLSLYLIDDADGHGEGAQQIDATNP